MKAVVTAGGSLTELGSVHEPQPGSGEIVLELIACGLCGTDLFKLQTGSPPPGTVLGHELVGTVVAKGENARFDVGERLAVPHHVACGSCSACRRGAETACAGFRINQLEPGGFAERILVRREAVERIARSVPRKISSATAVFLEPAACVLRGIDRAAPPTEEPGVFVVLGAGSMGLLHLLVLRSLRPQAVVVLVDRLVERRQWAQRLGAQAAVQADSKHLARALHQSNASCSGADAVFDTVGGSAPLALGLPLLREGGTFVLFAHAPDGEQASFDLNTLFKAERRIVATYSGSVGEQDRIWDLLCSGALDPSPLVTHHLPLSRFDHAVELCQSHQALKILLEPDS